MKRIKIRIGLALGAFACVFASPAVAMAATEAGEETRSLGETIEYALLNTVMGISIVFLSLLLISWIIGLFKYINKFANRSAEKAAANNKAPAPAPEPEAMEEEELSDDLALVAVVTAAIAAYEEESGEAVPADQLVVKSIKRVNKARWQSV